MDSFFIASKVLSFVQQPLDWILAALFIAAILLRLGRERAARRVIYAVVGLVVFLGIAAIPELVLQRLENRHPPAPVSPAFEGVIVLGGAAEPGVKPMQRRQVLLTSAAERLTMAVALARSHPDLKIVLTGYSGRLRPDGIAESDMSVQFFEEQGLSPSRVLLERQSRNTHEIALYAKQIPGVDASKPWLLLTSAWNMPRAILVFKKQDWNIHPFPVDYHTGTTVEYVRFSIGQGMSAWSVVLHETIGMAVYWLTGRI